MINPFGRIEFILIIHIIISIIFNLMYKRKNNKSLFINILIFFIISFILDISKSFASIIVGLLLTSFATYPYNEDISNFIMSFLLFSILAEYYIRIVDFRDEYMSINRNNELLNRNNKISNCENNITLYYNI